MESDFEILWTDLALEELQNTVDYLERNFTEKEIDKLGDEIERITAIICQNPTIFSLSDKLKTRKAVVLRFNSLYYRVLKTNIEIVSFFSNRQNPEKRKL